MVALAPASARVTVDGQTLSKRVRELIYQAAADAKIDRSRIVVVQGSYRGSSAAAASGSTHDRAGAFDLRTRTLTTQETLRLVFHLRRWNVAAWYRAPAYGWTQTGPHLHGIVIDEPGLSDGAESQVRDYLAGGNGLSGSSWRRDPFPHPEGQTYLLRRTTRITVRSTGVYSEPSWRSPKVATKVFGNPVAYVAIVRDVDGRRWLKTPSGNYVLAARTSVGR